MSGAEKVSIVVPTYNQAQYLPICLDSIWFQDYPEIEIVCVVDGSTDNTAEVLAAYQQALEQDQTSFAANYNEESNEVERRYHPRYPAHGRELKVIFHEQNKGLGPTLNTGSRACTGTYCTYIASDDMLEPTMASDLVRALEEGADLAYADMFVVDDIGRILRHFALPDYSFEATFCHWYFCGVCKLYRRELHEQFGYYREDLLSHDHELYQRFAMNGARLKHVRKVLARVRDHGAERREYNHSPKQWSRLFEESKALVREARHFLRDTSGVGR